MPVTNKLLSVQRFDSRDLAHYVALAKTKYSPISNSDDVFEESNSDRCVTSPSQSCRGQEDFVKKRTFLTVFLAKLLDCMALSSKTFAVADVKFNIILARLEDIIAGETGFIPPQAVGDLHLCVFKKLCRRFGTTERLLDMIIAEDPYFEEMVAKVFMQEIESSKQSSCSIIKPLTPKAICKQKIFLGSAEDGEPVEERVTSKLMSSVQHKPTSLFRREMKVLPAHAGDGDFIYSAHGIDNELINGRENEKQNSKILNKPLGFTGEKKSYIFAYEVGEFKQEIATSNATLRLVSKPMRSVSEKEKKAHAGSGDIMEEMRFNQTVCPKPIRCSSQKEIKVLPAPGSDKAFVQDMDNSKQSPGNYPKQITYTSRKRNKVFPAPHNKSLSLLSNGFSMTSDLKPVLDKEPGTLRMLFTCCAYTE